MYQLLRKDDGINALLNEVAEVKNIRGTKFSVCHTKTGWAAIRWMTEKSGDYQIAAPALTSISNVLLGCNAAGTFTMPVRPFKCTTSKPNVVYLWLGEVVKLLRK